jgi:hypothetical protein
LLSLQVDLNTSDKISGKNKKEAESQTKEKPAARVGISKKGIHELPIVIMRLFNISFSAT